MASLDRNQYRRRAARCLLTAGFAALMAAAAPMARAQQGVVAAAVLTQAPQDPAYPTLELLYTKFLSGGRSDVEIHLSPAGAQSGARVEPNSDGSFTCHVFGLYTPAGQIDARPSMRMLAGTLVHEATHCLVTPYALGIRPDADDPAAQIAGGLVLLTLESITDARAVIELYRKDGVEAAQEFAALMLPHRLMAASLSHSTAPALRAALQLVCTEPGTIQNDEQAFAAALRIGRTGAEYTYAWCVCPLKRTSTSADTPLTMSANAGPAAMFASSVAVPLGAPSWNVATRTSASPLAGSPSLSSAATRLTASTGSPIVTPTMPAGDTSAGVSSVTAPITPTRMPSKVMIEYSGSKVSPVVASYTLAPR